MSIKPTILIIEDNPENLQLITYLLKAHGYAPLVATDGEQGIATAARELPNLVLCDINMPVKDGYEVAKAFRASSSLRSLPLIAITSNAMVGDRERILASGFDGYISKPIQPESFVQEIESIFSSCQAANP